MNQLLADLNEFATFGSSGPVECKLMRDAADAIELLIEQRDELARQLGIEPEWTEDDA